MGPKKGENSKKAAGNAKKAEAAAQKQAVADAKQAKVEDAHWEKGAKDNSKQAAADTKAAEAARKKAEKAALLAEEEASQPSKPKGAGAKTAVKKSRGLDLSQLEATLASSTDPKLKNAAALNASGIDNALDALSLVNTGGQNDKIERHPEKRFKAAFTAFEARRLDEMAGDKTLRRQQKVDLIRKEFEKSPENPFNQALLGQFDMSKEDAAALRQARRDDTERRLENS